MSDREHKVWHTPASKRELEEIDSCHLCQLIPELAEHCRAVEYCHRQTNMFEGVDSCMNEDIYTYDETIEKINDLLLVFGTSMYHDMQEGSKILRSEKHYMKPEVSGNDRSD